MKHLLFFLFVFLTTSCAEQRTSKGDHTAGGEGGMHSSQSGAGGSTVAGTDTGEGGVAGLERSAAGSNETDGGHGGEGNSPDDAVGGHVGGNIGGEGGNDPQDSIAGAGGTGAEGGAGGNNPVEEPIEPLIHTLDEACAASPASQAICEVRQAEPGAMNRLVENAFVTGVGLPMYERDGFFIQIERAGPGLFIETDTTALEPAIERGQRVSFTVTETTEAITRIGLDPEDPNDEIQFTYATAMTDWQVHERIADLSFLETPIDDYHPFIGSPVFELEAFANLLPFSTLHKTISLNVGKATNFGETQFAHFLVGASEDVVREYGWRRNCEKRFTQTPTWVTDFGAHDIFLVLSDPAQFPIENCDLPDLLTASGLTLVPSKRGSTVNIRFSQLMNVETISPDTLEIRSSDTNQLFPITEVEWINQEALRRTSVQVTTSGLVSGSYEIIAKEGIENAYGDPIDPESNTVTLDYNEPDLVISEIFVNPVGTDETQFIEIYNPKSTPVRLADYAIALYEEEIQNLAGQDNVTLQFHRHLPLANDDRELPPYSFAVLTPDANGDGQYAWELPDDAHRITFGNGSESLFPHPGAAVLVNTSIEHNGINFPFLDSRLYITLGVPSYFNLLNNEISPQISRLVEPVNGFYLRNRTNADERDTSISLISSIFRLDTSSGFENIIHEPELDREADPTPGQ